MVKEKKLLDKEGIKINLIELQPGEQIPYHEHKDTKYNYILRGSMSDERGEYVQGDIVENLIDSRHSIKAGSEGCEFLVIWGKK